MGWWQNIARALAADGRCAAVTVVQVRGSAPREAGARMLVRLSGDFSGTIGGGSLEWHALAGARAALRSAAPGAALSRHNLGPDHGQCCGGSVVLLTESFDVSCTGQAGEFARLERNGPLRTIGTLSLNRLHRTPVPVGSPAGTGVGESRRAHALLSGPASIDETFSDERRAVVLFGAGHVGRALMLALAPLPFAVTWVDSRESAFPGVVPGNVQMLHHPAPVSYLNGAPHGAFVVVMTHSHPLDLEIVQAALRSARFPYVGLIGSKSKRARFSARLRQAGISAGAIDELVCPAGLGAIRSRQPAAIAVSIAAQLLARDDELLQTPARRNDGVGGRSACSAVLGQHESVRGSAAQ